MSWLDNLDQALNAGAADTIGVVYRATTGKVDPWTINEAQDKAYNDIIAAGGSAADAQAAADQVTQTAQTSPAATESNTSVLATWFQNLANDNGTGCDILTNPGGCVPSYVWYGLLAGGVLLVLYVLGPYVGLLGRR